MKKDVKATWRVIQALVLDVIRQAQNHSWLVIILPSVVAMVFGFLAILQPPGLEIGNMAAWASAIGTVLAVTVALTSSRQTRDLADRSRIDAINQLTETQRENRRLRQADYDNQERARLIQNLIDLLEAWDNYQGNPTSFQAKSRVRALISALPGDMARVAGIKVGVPRERYGETEFQPIHLTYWPPHGAILENHLERLEIEFNLKQVRGDATHAALQSELRHFIRVAEDPYNEAKLDAEQEAQIQARWEAHKRGEDHDGARVTDSD